MAASRFVGELIARTEALREAPEMGALYPVYGDGVRGLPLRPYVILYRVSALGVLVERVIHGARLPKIIP